MKLLISLSKSDKDAVVQKLIADLYAMTDPQLKTLKRGVWGIDTFLDSVDFMGRSFKGRMLVQSADDKSTAKFELAMNAMRWLTKYYFTDIVEGFPNTLYRLQAVRDSPRLKVGETHTFKPRKSMLSWTVLKKPIVVGRDSLRKKHSDVEETDYVISLETSKADILWSYKAAQWCPALLNGCKLLYAKKDKTHKGKLVRGVVGALPIALDANIAHEKEVTLYHPSKFKAEVFKRL